MKNKKINNRLLVASLVLVSIFAYYFFALDYINLYAEDKMRQRADYNQLTNQITETQKALMQIPAPPNVERNQLAAAQKELEELENKKDVLPKTLNVNLIIKDILAKADNSGVTVSPLTTEPWATIKGKSNEYDALKIGLTATGGLADLNTFIQKLEKEISSALLVTGVTIKQNTEEEDASGEGGSTEVSTESAPSYIAKIDLTCYKQH